MAFTKKQQKETFKTIIIAFVKITITGIIIGVFHKHDFWVGLLLFTYLLVFLYKNYLHKASKNWILLAGMIITGILGILQKFGV